MHKLKEICMHKHKQQEIMLHFSSDHRTLCEQAYLCYFSITGNLDNTYHLIITVQITCRSKDTQVTQYGCRSCPLRKKKNSIKSRNQRHFRDSFDNLRGPHTQSNVYSGLWAVLCYRLNLNHCVTSVDVSLVH